VARGGAIPPRTEQHGPVRCAIYTRKSTEEGLEQEFNSLDAQHEACSAYILSQRHEGWIQVKGRYDDGGFSGATMERPGLKQLLADVAAAKVDVIVVYKVDRLTRALSDFAKIVEVLDARGASFVSVTQAFNTTTSMGRLTLNVLLSFAQFEREVTGERIRDKIAASKKKGMWMGGTVPLGYWVQDRKLIIEETDAKLVRHIFERYRALGTGRLLTEELRANGYRTKERPVGGMVRGGIPFTRGMLFHMLSNAIYIGKIVHQGIAHEGEHEAIISPALWEDVQRQIESNRVERRNGSRSAHSSLLAGMIIDGLGRRMTPSHAVKGNKRYRYYVTHDAELRDGEPAAWRLPSRDLEHAVAWRLQQMLKDRQELRSTIAANVDGATLVESLAAALRLANQIDASPKCRSIISELVQHVQVHEQRIQIRLDTSALRKRLNLPAATAAAEFWIEANATRVRTRYAAKLIIADASGQAVEADERLIALLREAQAARAAALDHPERNLKEMAAQQHQCRRRLTRLIKLSWLAPDIVSAIVEGRHPHTLTPKQLLAADVPLGWSEQRELLGFA
jgi:DNA invertase Pin-like site-specific DNA recombinase